MELQPTKTEGPSTPEWIHRTNGQDFKTYWRVLDHSHWQRRFTERSQTRTLSNQNNVPWRMTLHIRKIVMSQTNLFGKALKVISPSKEKWEKPFMATRTSITRTRTVYNLPPELPCIHLNSPPDPGFLQRHTKRPQTSFETHVCVALHVCRKYLLVKGLWSPAATDQSVRARSPNHHNVCVKCWKSRRRRRLKFEMEAAPGFCEESLYTCIYIYRP